MRTMYEQVMCFLMNKLVKMNIYINYHHKRLKKLYDQEAAKSISGILRKPRLDFFSFFSLKIKIS